MKHVPDSTFDIEEPVATADDLVSNVTLSSDVKADVLIALMGVFHNNIVSWTTRRYEASTWALGVQYAVVSYFYIGSTALSTVDTIVLAFGLLLFGMMTQLYLRAAARAHHGNRLGISKCEAALGLYKPEEYLAGRTFFTYSMKMLGSRNLEVIRIFHITGTTVAVVLLFLIRFLK